MMSRRTFALTHKLQTKTCCKSHDDCTTVTSTTPVIDLQHIQQPDTCSMPDTTCHSERSPHVVAAQRGRGNCRSVLIPDSMMCPGSRTKSSIAQAANCSLTLCLIRVSSAMMPQQERLPGLVFLQLGRQDTTANSNSNASI